MSDVNNLTGRVTALPQLDSTLTKAGFCADAKAAGDAIAQYKEEINGDVDEKLSEVDGKLSAATTEMNTNIEAFEKQITDDFAENISTLDARITNLASLEEGSTTGDAELADIRVGADGTVYESAGEAVRGQVSNLKSDLSDLDGELNKIVGDTMIIETSKNRCPSILYNGYLNSDGSLTVELDWKSTDFVYVGDCESVVYSVTQKDNGERIYGHSMWFITTYDANKTVIEQPTGVINTYTVGDNVEYIRFSVHSDMYHELMVENGTSATEYEEYKTTYKTTGNKEWHGKKWVCLGDSLTEHNSRTTMNYHDYVAGDTAIAVINMGHSGSGYKRSEEDGNAFYQRAANVPTDADVVTIFGSGNDLLYIDVLGTYADTGTDTLGGCINTTIDSIIALNPNVSLGIVSPTPWVGEQPTVDDSNSMARYTELLRQICKVRSIPFLDLYHCSNLRPWTEEGRNACYTRDDGNGVHPDENGHRLIAPRFKAFLDTLIY